MKKEYGVLRNNLFIRRKMFLCTLIISMIICTLSAYGADKPLKKIQFGYNVGSIMSPLVVIADQAGLFKKEGLDVELINLGTEGPNAVNQGKVYGYPFGVAGLQWVAKKGDVVFYGGTMNEGSTYITRPENEKLFNPKNLKAFKGKKVGVTRLSSADYSVREYIQAAGVDTNKEVTYIEFDSIPSIIEAVNKGAVDIGVTSLEQGLIAERRGLKIAFYTGEVAPDYVCCKQIGNRKLIKENRDVYVALLKAQIQAYKIYLQDHEKTIGYLMDYSNQTREFVISVLYEPNSFKHFIVTPDPYRNKLRAYYKLLENEGIVAKGVNIDNYVDITIYRDALNKVIKEFPKDPVYKKLLAEYPKNNL